MRSLLAGVLVALASGCFYVPDPGPGPGPSSDGTITIDNASAYVLTEVRITAIDSTTWGANLLRGDVLYPDERFTVAVVCDVYDVLIVDEFNRDCILDAVDLCFSDQLWVIDNTTLRYCAF